MPPRRSARSKKAGPRRTSPSNSNDEGSQQGRAAGGGSSHNRTKDEGSAPRSGKGKKGRSSRTASAPASHDHSIGECLDNVGVTRVDLETCPTLDDEFQAIKRSYFKKILQEHPDKGGDPDLFRRTRTSFEVLRDLKGRGNLHSFLPHLGDDARAYYERVYEEYQHEEGEGGVPSYEYYQEAADEVTPGYKVELAKSSRSQCVVCKRTAASGKKFKVAPRGITSAAGPMFETAVSDPTPSRQLVENVVPSSVLGTGGFDTTHESDAGRHGPPSKKKARTVAAGSTAISVAGDPGTLVARATTVKTLAFPAPPPTFIGKDAIRVGSLDDRSGSYGRWSHLGCWRVPYRVWAGLQDPDNRSQVLLDLIHMDQVLLTGLSRLPIDSQQAFVDHVMNKAHWARKTKASKPPPPPPNNGVKMEWTSETSPQAGAPRAPSSSEAGLAESTTATTAIVERKAGAKATFVLPRPGLNGAVADCFSGKTFVLSGIFPEVGGGAGLNLGKDRVKAMIQSFGGRTTSAISGKTNFLVVGKEPGMSKVGKARAMKLPMVDLAALASLAYGTVERLEDAPPPVIKSFSAGYMGSGLLGYD